MLQQIYEKVVMKRSNQKAKPKPVIHKVGIFSCDQCNSKFEIERCLQQKLNRKHHFCSRKCQGQARKEGGCLHYVYDTFVNPFSIPTVQKKIRQTMLARYGASTTLASPILHEKVHATMIERYGGPTPFSAPKLRNRLDFSEMARKRHVTMKRNGAYKRSKEEELFGEYLSRFGTVETHIIINKIWPIDFYLPDHNVYVQFDGVYWHGLDRPIEEIRESKSLRDIHIHKKWLTDRKQECWFSKHNLILIRVPSSKFDRRTMTCVYFEQALEAVSSFPQHQLLDLRLGALQPQICLKNED